MQDSPDLPQHMEPLSRRSQSEWNVQEWKSFALWLLGEYRQAAVLVKNRDHRLRLKGTINIIDSLLAGKAKNADKRTSLPQHPIHEFVAVVQPKRGRGAPTKLEKARKKALMTGGDAEFAEYLRLWDAVKNPTKKRRERAKKWTKEGYALLRVLRKIGEESLRKEGAVKVSDIKAMEAGLMKLGAREKYGLTPRKIRAAARNDAKRLSDYRKSVQQIASK